MKKIIPFLLFAFPCLFILSSCSDSRNIKNPEDVGKHAFEILKKMDGLSKKDFINNFITLEELKNFTENKKLDLGPEISGEINSISDDYFNMIMGAQYDDIKQSTVRYEIKWPDIVYDNFLYDIEMSDGLQMCAGELYFNYESDPYSIEVYALFDGKNYKLYRIEYLFDEF